MFKLPKKESETAEFKTSYCEKTIETLVAFANAKGGIVYIGISDNGKVIGTLIGKETNSKIVNDIKTKTYPQIFPEIEEHEINDKKILTISVMESFIKPISIKGNCYKRIGSSNHLLNVEEISYEHLKTINSSWDFFIDPNHTYKYLSKEKISKFVKNIKESGIFQNTELTDLEILNKMEFLRDGKITFGAYLLFVSDYCSISDLQIGRFKSETKIIDSKSLNTDLFTEVDEVLLFVRKHLKVEYIITGAPQRVERFDYPEDALREIVINMIVHRDYRDCSSSIIKIYDDRIEFYNPGKLYGGITIQDLLYGKYISRSRNKMISRAFKEVGLIEKSGSGIIRVRNICKDFGIKEPDFHEVFDGFRVILYNERIKSVEKSVDKSSAESVEKSVEKNINLVLYYIMNNPNLTQNEIALHVGLSRRGIEKCISKLKADGKLERIGSKRSGYWKVIQKP